MKNLQDSITVSTSNTPPMAVRVIDVKGSVIKSFEAPTGFILEDYVRSLYPKNTFMLTFSATEKTVSVIDEKDSVFEVYHGRYLNR